MAASIRFGVNQGSSEADRPLPPTFSSDRGLCIKARGYLTTEAIISIILDDLFPAMPKYPEVTAK